MILRSVAFTLAVSLCALFGASAPANARDQVVTVTNESNVCVRFDAIGIELRAPSSFPDRSGSAYIFVGQNHLLTARPGETVRFYGLQGTRAHVFAHLHATSECTAFAGVSYGPYETQGPNEHIAFRHNAFFHVANL